MSATSDTGKYPRRIGYACSAEPTTETLRALDRQHLLAVPFENLDIHVPRELAKFARMCRCHQTSPESHFTPTVVPQGQAPEARRTGMR